MIVWECISRAQSSKFPGIYDLQHGRKVKSPRQSESMSPVEARKMKAAGQEILKHTRWCLLKRQENLTDDQRFHLRDLLAYNLRTVRA